MVNSFEQFEKSQIEHEIEAAHELKKIDIVAAKLTEKFGEYEALRSFVTYLASMEKVFARSRIYDSSPTTIKDEIIKTEMQLFSAGTALDEDILKSIRDDFNIVYATVTQIYAIAEKLFQKFSEKEECEDFIASLRDIAVVFIQAHEKHFSIGEIQDQVYRSQMRILSADGEPNIILLEKIYAEFKKELEVAVS
jgi:hypothetical protein